MVAYQPSVLHKNELALSFVAVLTSCDKASN